MSIEVTIEGFKPRVFTYSEDAIRYLNSKDISSDKKVLKKFLKDNPIIKTIDLGAIGTYYKYECAGETSIHEPFDMEYAITFNEEMSEEVYETMLEEYSDKFQDAVRFDLLKYCDGEYPQRGFSLFTARLDGNKLVIEESDYDCE